MIFYFSATGNSKYVAEKIAQKNGDRIISIGQAMKSGKLSFAAAPGEDIGFVTPTYYWGIPDIVYEFLNTATIIGQQTERYVYHVLTCGTVTGGANTMLQQALMKNFGLMVHATFAVKMVDNYVPMFDCSDDGANRRVEEEAEPEILKIAEKIASRELGEHNYYRGAWALAWPVAQILYERARRTENFSVTDACIHCGLCQKQCPVNAIELKENKPVWVREKCTECFGCLHRCPAHAIRYGKKDKTFLHGQYVNPNTSPDL